MTLTYKHNVDRIDMNYSARYLHRNFVRNFSFEHTRHTQHSDCITWTIHKALSSACLYVCVSVCLSVCLSSRIFENQFSRNFLYMAWSSLDDNAIVTQFRFFCMTSCFRIIELVGHIKDSAYVSSSTPGSATGGLFFIS